ncbi:SusC/RagA family TonB-linked outer membrane protein [Chitinophaga solisilvae]|uniref:SusC/RagA family TonB-linked outer membrane protein n=1 Tax=Chitinophaga solisilvae TaxID=1233460 RepID=UPI00136EB8EA|nr:SusC/RagA family TonB-linked outer membrane protein [Chitinophaga solisilvae]
MKRGLLLWLFVAISVMQTFAQTRTIKGKVTDSKDGSALPGVTVSIKGTSTGTVTGHDGGYKLDAPANATLVFSFVGYLSSNAPANKEVINIQLSADSKQLSEYVVTALGVTREKKALGYAVGTIKSDELVRAANPNLATAIQGKVSGVEVRPSSGMPGASAQILIRGARFFDSNNTPLYVVDGMPINSNSDYVVGGNGVTGTDFAGRSIDIDPNDIESMSVLKGQAASALYGMRASNGVIMITTKSGKNNAKGKPVISVSTNYQQDQISRLPKVQNTFAQGQVDGNGKPTYTNVGSLAFGPEISTLPNDPKFGGNVPNAFNNNNPTDATKGRYWSPQHQAWLLPQAHNNAKEFFENGSTTNLSLNMSQAFNAGNYSFGFGTTNQKGIVPVTGMKRSNAKFAGSFDVSPKVKVGTSLNLSTVKIDKLPTGNNSILFEIYGAPASVDMKGMPYGEPLNPYQQISYRAGSFDNPYWSNAHNSFSERTRRFFGNAFVNYEPIKDLNIRYQLGTDIYTTDMEEIYEMGSAPTGGSTVPGDGEYPSQDLPSGGNIINRSMMNRTFNSLLNITYFKKLSDQFNLNAMLGNEVNDNTSRFIRGEGSEFIIGGYHNMANTSVQTTSETKFNDRRVGFFGSVGLDWNKMLYLNVSARNEYVSTMPSANRSFFYPSASLAWVASELPVLRDKDIFAKFRASIAQVGSAGTYKQRVYVTHSSGGGFLTDGISFPFNDVVGYRPEGTLYDPNLRPQNTKSVEFGAELGFIKNRISLEYTYTRQNTIDQIFRIPLAGSTGYAAVVKNGGQMLSNVHEVSLKLIPVRTKDFEWTVGASYTKIKNDVKSLAPGVESIYLGGFTTPQVRAAIGYTYPAIYGSTFARTKEGKLILDGNGIPIAGPEAVIGTVTPDFLADFNTAFRYKFLRLSALLAWKSGGQMYSGANRLMDLYGASERTMERTGDKLYEGVSAATVKPDNTGGEPNTKHINTIAGFQTLYNTLGNIAEAHIYNTSFLKLREVALGIDLPKEILRRTKVIKSATLNISARNILLWTELPNFDPESSQGNGNMQGGFDYMSLPQTRSFGAGLNLTF